MDDTSPDPTIVATSFAVPKVKSWSLDMSHNAILVSEGQIIMNELGKL